MRTPCLLLLAATACHTGDDPAEPDAFPPPPAPLIVPPCAPGSAFELDGVAFTDLQAALDAAMPNATIVVCTGTHTIGEVLGDELSGVTLAGETSDPADVTLTGGTLTLYANPPQPPTRPMRLSGLTFRDTRVETAALELRIADVVFTEGNASLLAQAHDLTIHRSAVLGCQSPVGVVVQAAPIRDNVPVRLTLDDVLFQDNQALSIFRFESGRVRPPHTVQLRDVDFVNNVATGNNFSLISLYSNVSVRVLRGSVVGNEATDGELIGFGGIIKSSYIKDWTVTDNVSRNETFTTSGRGPYDPNGLLVIRDSSFLRNQSSEPTFGPGILTVRSIRTRLSNVDFGTGADTNLPGDITSCGVDYGLIPSAILRVDEPCPR